ncbi:MAG: hypothetical protein ACOYOD_13460 [Saprospiraceae bacterium]|jgi:hypothetical protein
MSNKLVHSKKKQGQGHNRQSTEGKKVLLIILAATLILILILFAVSS